MRLLPRVSTTRLLVSLHGISNRSRLLSAPPHWYLDTAASSHMTSHSSALSHFLPPQDLTPPSIVVGNGSLLPVTGTSFTDLPGSFCLNNVLVSPQLIKNLISVR